MAYQNLVNTASEYKTSIIPNYIYFYHINEYCIIPLYPETIDDSMKTTFGSQNALSRSAPVFTFSNSGPRTVTISLELHRSMMNDVNKDNAGFIDSIQDKLKSDDYVDILINHLQSIALPNYKANKSEVVPPMIATRFGNDIFIKGIVDSGVTVSYEKPILDNNKYAKAKISFTVSEVDPFDADYVKQNGSFRGIAAPIYAFDSSATIDMNKNGLYYDNIEAATNIKYKNNYGVK